MARKQPRLEHVKYVTRRGKVYAYFNTGLKRDGKVIYSPLPSPASVGFFDSYATAKAVRTKRQSPQFTVAALGDEYLASADFADKAPNTQKLYRSQIAKIADNWGRYPVSDLDQADVRLVLDNAGWAPGTRNTVMAVLGVLYTWARKRGRTTLSPVKDIERAKGGEHDPWPEDILEAGLTASDATVRLAVHLLYFTGQRIGDACAIRWGDIRGNVLYVTPEKTKKHGKRLHVPIHAELRDELARTKPQGLTILHGLTERTLRIALKAFTRALGVETVPHGLRKNAVNALLEAGCTIAEVAAITGQTYQIVEHYAAKVDNRKLGQAAMLKFERGRAK